MRVRRALFQSQFLEGWKRKNEREGCGGRVNLWDLLDIQAFRA